MFGFLTKAGVAVAAAAFLNSAQGRQLLQRAKALVTDPAARRSLSKLRGTQGPSVDASGDIGAPGVDVAVPHDEKVPPMPVYTGPVTEQRPAKRRSGWKRSRTDIRKGDVATSTVPTDALHGGPKDSPGVHS